MSKLQEKTTEELSDVCFTAGSTHVLKTCKIDNDSYFLKFGDESLFDNNSDPDLQILVEYLAYRLYSAYPGISIPKGIHLVFDKRRKRVGLATQKIRGSSGGSVSPKKLGKLLSAGVFVDIFLANWDVLGTGKDNVLVGGNIASRIDPGGALTFRAQGEKKDLSPEVPELKRMLDKNRTAGSIFQYSDLKQAARTFSAASPGKIKEILAQTNDEVVTKLTEYGMTELLQQWKSEYGEIYTKLGTRHNVVRQHINHILSESRLKVLISLLIERELKTKSGSVIDFKVTENARDENDAWVLHEIEAFIDGNPAGRIKLSYIPKAKFDERFKHTVDYMAKVAGHGAGYLRDTNNYLDLPLDRKLEILSVVLGGWPIFTDRVDISTLSEEEKLGHIKELEKQVEEKNAWKLKQFKDFHVDKPLVDFIEVKPEYRRNRIAAALYEYAARWLAKKGMKLYASGIQSPQAKAAWEWIVKNKKANVGKEKISRNRKPLVRTFLSYL